MTNNENRLVDVEYVMTTLNVSESRAYRIIRTLNKELTDAGIKTIAGRVSRRYLENRYLATPDEVNSNGN